MLVFEKQLQALHVVHTFHLFNRYVIILLTKMRTETKTVPLTWHIFILIFTYVPYRNRPNFIGKSEALLLWLVICLIFWWFYLSSVGWLGRYWFMKKFMWGLEILLRTIVAAVLKTKDIKKRARNISQLCKWTRNMRVTNVLLLEQHLMPYYTYSAHLPPQKHTHTHQQNGPCLPNDLCLSYLQPTPPFFQFPSRWKYKFSYHTTVQK